MNQKEHWENVYKAKSPTEVSWFQPHLAKSLELIALSGIDAQAGIIDIGGGASTLADDLLNKGYSNISVLDVSAAALEVAKKRLGNKAGQVHWIEGDITTIKLPEKRYDLWHDRAVFHFLTESAERKKYIETLKNALKPEGFLVMATFSLEGPLKCSGLDVIRYSQETLSRELGDGFSFLKSSQERHETPFHAFQNFNYCLFKRS